MQSQNHSTTYDELLNVVMPFIPEALLGVEDRLAMLRLAKRLPALVNAILEFPLGTKAPIGDFLVSANANFDEKGRLAGLMQGENRHPFWRQLDHFCQGWSRQEAGVEKMWLEFDRKDVFSSAPLPSVFLGFARHPSPVEVRGAYRKLLPKDPFADQIECLWEALPTHARVIQIGRMIARGDMPARICIIGLTRDEWVDWLSHWGKIPEEKWMPFFELGADNYLLQFDVSTDVHPLVGIECYIGHPDRFQRWSRFLEKLVGMGLCTLLPKAKALMQFWGVEHEGKYNNWPSEFSRASALKGRQMESTLVRTLNHVKIVVGLDRETIAKGYLLCRHSWIESL